MSLNAAAASVSVGNKQRNLSEDSRPHLELLHMARLGHAIAGRDVIRCFLFILFGLS